MPTEFPTRPWSMVGAAEAVIEHFKSIFAHHGIPEVVRSDNGPQFASEGFRAFARGWGFDHVTSSPHFPQSNWEAERAVRTIKSLLKKSADPYLALMAYRVAPLTNGYSPAELLMGRKLRMSYLIGTPRGAVSCPNNNLSIKDGSFTLSKSYNDGSILRYVCPVGFYPGPEKKLQCNFGQWDPEPSSKQECKKVTCPNPKVLENGVVIPSRKIYYVNDTTKYRCNSDYTFRGSATRECQANGKWSGGTPICSRNTDFTYDTPGEVAEAFGSSLKTTVTMYEESDKGDKTGTNIHNAYEKILESISLEEAHNKVDFDETQHVIIMFTDGIYNSGGNPKGIVGQIREKVIRDKKDREKYLDEGTSMALCGLYKSYSEPGLKSSMRLTYPWLIKIVITYNGNTANCIGSLVTPRFILTAAHCFRFDDVNDQIQLEALNSKDIQIPGVERFYLHKQFNITQKRDKGITEFYDYDVALIQLTEGVKISPDLR
ncbi:complement component bfb isoform X1 [Silurus meridionalis]|nr:complement component bfb isoform X1 [Silurus meridionalis]